MEELIKEIELYSELYDITFELLSICRIVKITDRGKAYPIFECTGIDLKDLMEKLLQWIYKVNRIPKHKRVC